MIRSQRSPYGTSLLGAGAVHHIKLWSVNVIVHEGVVELWGIVDTAAEKRAIRVVAEATPGVREVIDHTT